MFDDYADNRRPLPGCFRLNADGIRDKWVTNDRRHIFKLSTLGSSNNGAAQGELMVWEAMRDTWLGALLAPTLNAGRGWSVQPFYDGCTPLSANYISETGPWWSLTHRVRDTLEHYGIWASDIYPHQFVQLPNGSVKLVDYEFTKAGY